MTFRSRFFLVAGLLFFFIGLSSFFWSRPIDTWEWLNFAASQEVARSGIPATGLPPNADSLLLIHPPLWAHAAGLWAKWMPGSVVPVRAAGTAVGVLTLIVFWGFSGFLLASFPEKRHQTVFAASLATTLLLTNPAFLQGTLYISFNEGTLLPLAFVLFGWAWMALSSEPLFSIRRLATLIVILAFAFWTKISTSLILPLGMGATALLQTPSPIGCASGVETRGEKVGPVMALFGRLSSAAVVSVGGVALFLLTWSLYVYRMAQMTSLPFHELVTIPISYIGGQGKGGLMAVFSHEGMEAATTTLIRLVLYFGPLLCLLALWEMGIRAFKIIKDREGEAGDLIYLLIAGVSVAYLLLQGGSGSFPKYHLAILPFLVLFTTRRIVDKDGAWDKRTCAFLIFGAVAGTLYYAFVVGDYLFEFNYVLRRVLYDGGSLLPWMRTCGIKMGLYAAFPCGLYGVIRLGKARISWRTLLTAVLIGSQSGLVVAQARGGYFLYHSYGSSLQEMGSVLEAIRSQTPPHSQVLALPEIAYLADRPMVEGLHRYHWDDAEKLAELVRAERPSAVVYGFPLNTIHQMKQVFTDKRFIGVLIEEGYVQKTAGDYILWLNEKDHRGPVVSGRL